MASQSYIKDLGTNDEMVKNRLRFFRSYADRSSELDRRIIEAESESARISARVPTEVYPRWQSEAARADALAQASQHALLVADERGQELLEAAGLAYAALGVPFGYALLAIGRDRDRRWPSSLEAPDVAFRALLNALLSATHGETVQGPLSEAMRYPNQQTYLLIALALSQHEPSGSVGQLLESGLQNSGVAIGPTANTVGDYWKFVDLVMTRTSHSTDTLLAGAFELAQPYARAITKARRNGYVWERLLAPVDIIDLDVVMLSALMARVHGIDRKLVLSWSRRHGRDPIESIPIAIGCEIVRETGTTHRTPQTAL